MKTKGPIIGIDLGTTYSLVGAFLSGRPTLFSSSLQELLTPSAVSVTEDGTVLVGAPARARATTHPEETFLGFKRDMGTDKVFEAHGKSFTAPELSAMVLAALKRDAEDALGVVVEEAVVTVPAYFGDLQRQATRDAGAIAGLKVERIINEPTAAALAYGLHNRDREVRVAVLDLGGGTFDVTILEIIEGVVEIQSSAGDIRLGGDDFDEALAERVATRIDKSHGEGVRENPIAWARLVSACEAAKRRLSIAATARIALPDLFVSRSGAGSVELEITREEAEDAWAPWIEKLRGPVDRALIDAAIGPDRIDEVLLVGGSTRMPCVTRVAAQRFGRLPSTPLPPDEAVAMGAAVQAALKAQHAEVGDLVITDVAPFSLGIATAEIFGPSSHVSGLFTPILERGTVIPASRVKRFWTMQPNQKVIRVEVFQGERSLCKDNRHLGLLKVEGLPPGDAGEVGIDIRFTYNQNGILEVEATVPQTGKKHSLVLEQVPGRLGNAEIAEARKNIERLKLDPRDTLPNRTALTRADALYAELTGPSRELLGRAIAHFQSALQEQDEDAIVASREQLIILTRQASASR